MRAQFPKWIVNIILFSIIIGLILVEISLDKWLISFNELFGWGFSIIVGAITLFGIILIIERIIE